MEQLILVVHVLAALAIIGLILLQQGKGAEMGASFGAGASQTLFGSAGGGNVLTRATAVLAVVFFLTSLGLAYVAQHRAEVGEDTIELPALEESRDVAPVTEGEIPAPPSQGSGTPAQDDIPASDQIPE